MKDFSKEEIVLIDSLVGQIKEIDMNIVNSIINKMIINKEYANLIEFLNNLNDFAEVPKNFVDKLINENNKECIAFFLNNEDMLYFFTDLERNKLKEFLNVKELFIKLPESYDYYYNLLFKQGIRELKSKTNNNIVEHYFSKANRILKGFKIMETDKLGVVVSYVNYLNYILLEEEQMLKEIDYINSLGFNIDIDINNENIFDNINNI